MDERFRLRRSREPDDRNFSVDIDRIYQQQQRQKQKKAQAPRTPQKLKPRKKKRHFSILKIMFMTILLVVLLATGALSAGVAWYVVKLSEDLPSMVELANPKNSLPSIV